jgi:flavin-dependent dehydrogenase
MSDRMQRHDVIVLGGGLAGLTLALQLRQRFADIDVLVLERRAHPVPEAAHKVGESSVEIGAHYFAKVLGLREHLQQQQLKKFGFRFFFSEGRRDIDQTTEVGASRLLDTPAYQIDRGIFENFLGAEAVRRGIRFIDQASVRDIVLAGAHTNPAGAACGREADAASEIPAPSQTAATGERLHRVTWQQQDDTHTAEARWVVDASGRAGLLKRRLGLAESNDHDVNAIWFRIQDRIAIDDWSDNEAWQQRCHPRARWLSTNHLCGAGYWAWLIPLASGSHSVGIVADEKLHPLDTINTFDKAMQWFAQYQPRLFDELDGRRHLLQDFAYFRHFSYGCKQVFSDQRWALTGDAGLFLDPFYSPGSDFIAIGNTYICELIARDRAGQPLQAHTHLFGQLYQSFYESTLALYVDQYDLFGDPEVMPVKVIWDYAYYWGILAQLYFQNRLIDLSALSRLRDELALCQKLNKAVQALLRDWSPHSRKRNAAVMLDHAALPWFAELNRDLSITLDDAGFHARIQKSTLQLRVLAEEILQRARLDAPDIEAKMLAELIGDDLPAAGAPMLFPRAA